MQDHAGVLQEGVWQEAALLLDRLVRQVSELLEAYKNQPLTGDETALLDAYVKARLVFGRDGVEKMRELLRQD